MYRKGEEGGMMKLVIGSSIHKKWQRSSDIVSAAAAAMEKERGCLYLYVITFQVDG